MGLDDADGRVRIAMLTPACKRNPRSVAGWAVVVIVRSICLQRPVMSPVLSPVFDRTGDALDVGLQLAAAEAGVRDRDG